MRQSGQNGDEFGCFDPPDWVGFLRHRHPVKPAAAIAASADVSVRTAQKWLDGTARPSFAATVRLIGAYGPEFLASCLPGCGWIALAAGLSQRAALGAELARLERRLTHLRERS